MRVWMLPLGSRTWSRLILRKLLWSIGVLLMGVSVRFMVVPLGWLGQPEMLGLLTFNFCSGFCVIKW